MKITINVPEVAHGVEIIETIAEYGGVPIGASVTGDVLARPASVVEMETPATGEGGWSGTVRVFFRPEGATANIEAHSEEIRSGDLPKGRELLAVIADLVNNWTFEKDGLSYRITVDHG